MLNIFQGKHWYRINGFAAGLVLVLALFWGSVSAVEVKVTVEGVEDELLKNVEAFLQIAQEATAGDLTVTRMNRLHAKAPDQIRAALQPFGYYGVVVDSDLKTDDQKASQWRTLYRVTPGEPTKVGHVAFEVTGEAAEDEGFPRTFGVSEGDRFVHSDYEDAKNALLLAAAGRGYLDARFERSRVTVDPERATADIDVSFAAGARYYFGPVRVEQEILDPGYLERFVHLERGEPYDQNAVLKLQTSLYDTDYFRRVEMEPVLAERDPDTGEVPLRVVAVANKRDLYRIGAGFATDIGPKITFDWTRRWVNRSGHRSKVELVVAQKSQSLNGEYRIPLSDPVKDYFYIKPELYRLDTSTRLEETASVDAARSSPWFGWRRVWGVQYRYENYDIADESEYVNELVPFVELSRTVSDNPLYTAKGYRLKFSLLGTVEYVGSTSNYVSATASGKWVRRFADDYRFITRADLGATWADSIQDVPGSRRFFAGGDQSIRGYDFEDLGPRDPDTGKVIGGRYLGVGSLELERVIEGDWSAAVFYDFGNAFDPDLDNEFMQSVGVGARWRSPIGQIRLDLGVGIESDDTPVRLHLVIGPDL